MLQSPNPKSHCQALHLHMQDEIFFFFQRDDWQCSFLFCSCHWSRVFCFMVGKRVSSCFPLLPFFTSKSKCLFSRQMDSMDPLASVTHKCLYDFLLDTSNVGWQVEILREWVSSSLCPGSDLEPIYYACRKRLLVFDNLSVWHSASCYHSQGMSPELW